MLILISGCSIYLKNSLYIMRDNGGFNIIQQKNKALICLLLTLYFEVAKNILGVKCGNYCKYMLFNESYSGNSVLFTHSSKVELILFAACSPQSFPNCLDKT